MRFPSITGPVFKSCPGHHKRRILFRFALKDKELPNSALLAISLPVILQVKDGNIARRGKRGFYNPACFTNKCAVLKPLSLADEVFLILGFSLRSPVMINRSGSSGGQKFSYYWLDFLLNSVGSFEHFCSFSVEDFYVQNPLTSEKKKLNLDTSKSHIWAASG